MNIPKGYKQTELGIIPEDWEVVTIDEVLSMPTKTISTSSFDHKFYIGTENMLSAKRGVSPYSGTFPYLQVREYLTYDILTSNIRPYLKKIWLADKCGGCSSDVIVFRVKDTNIICPTYIYTIISDDSFFRYSMDSAIGTKMPRGDKSAIKTYSFAIPQSLPEQKAIAKALSDVDGLIAALDKKIAKKRLIKQGAMQQLLTGKKRLPGFTEKWKTICLKDIGTLYNGYAFRSEAYTDTGQYKIVTIANVQNGRLTTVGCSTISIIPNDLQDYQQLRIGDILVSMTGNVGRICIVNSEKCLLNQRVGLFRIKTSCRYDKLFIYNILNCSNFENTMIDCGQGAAQSNISKKDIEGFEFTAPIDMREQQAIATILCDMDKEIANLETMRDKYRLIKSGMMHKLLIGQIRLKQK